MNSLTQTYVTKEALLGEIVELYPEAVPVIQEYGLHCVGCFASGFDTIEIGCKVHGFDDAIIDEMIERVNAVIHQTRTGSSHQLVPEDALPTDI